jgi:hypothetical protein
MNGVERASRSRSEEAPRTKGESTPDRGHQRRAQTERQVHCGKTSRRQTSVVRFFLAAAQVLFRIHLE